MFKEFSGCLTDWLKVIPHKLHLYGFSLKISRFKIIKFIKNSSNSPIMNAHVILEINGLRKNGIANLALVIFLARVKLLMRPQTRVAREFATANIATKRLIVERLCWLICGRCVMLNGMMMRRQRWWRLRLVVMMNGLDLNRLHFLRWTRRWTLWIFCTRCWIVTSSDNHYTSSIASVTFGDCRDGFLLASDFY